MNTISKILGTIIGVFAWFTILHAGNVKWSGTTSQNWSAPTAWVGNIVPTSIDTALFDGTSTNPCHVDSNTSCAKLVINGWGQTLTINAGDTLTVNGDLSQAGAASTVEFANAATSVLNIGGNLTNTSGTFNTVNGEVRFVGTDQQTVEGVSSFHNLTINGSWYVSFSANVSVAGLLTLSGAGIKMNGDTLSVAAVSGGYYNGYVDGTIIRTLSGAGTYVFPTGSTGGSTGAGYVTMHATAGSFPATVEVTSLGSHAAFVSDPAHSLARQWILTTLTGSVDSADLTFEYQSGEADPADEQAYVLGLYNGSAWIIESSGVPDTTDPYMHTLSMNGATTIPGTWTAGKPSALPIVLSFFTASVTSARYVNLNWWTESETNTLGFIVERRDGDAAARTAVSGLIPGAGTSLQRHNYSFTDTAVSAGTHYYRLKEVDLDGTATYSTEIKVAVTGVLGAPDTHRLPSSFGLGQNYPNPFNPSTVINYELPKAEYVRLVVYDMLGREVATLLDGAQDAGYKSVEFSAAILPSGIYYYRLQAGNFIETKKLLLLK